MDEKRDTKVTIKIPRPLYNSLKTLIEESGFNSVNDFIVFVLRDIASVTNNEADGGQLKKEEIDSIKEKLRNLGYL
jgi:hypothetical protein